MTAIDRDGSDGGVAVRVDLPSRRLLGRSQELIWAAQRLRPDVPLANTANTYRITGAIDPARFVAAFDTVVRASDALRTVVADDAGVPRPRLLREPPARTELIDLTPDAVGEWVRERIATPLAIDRCPYDSVLIRHAPDDVTWYVNIHHVTVDAWATALVFRATADAYHGRPLELPSFGDHLAALSDATDTEAWRRASEWWAARCDPVAPPTFYRDGPETTRNHRLTAEWGPARAAALHRLLDDDVRPLSTELGVLTALATATIGYVYRLSPQPVVRIAVPVHHRRTAEARSTIGLLMELFPLEVSVEPDETLRSLYDKVGRGIIELLRWARPGTSPRLDVDVVLNVITTSCGAFGELPATAEWIHSDHVDPVHRLRVQYYDFTGSGTPTLALDVNDAIAGPVERERMPGHLLAVLDALTADISQPLSEIVIVGDDERRSLVDDFNRSGGPAGDPERSVAAEIPQALGEIGDRVALVDGATELTGHELERRIGVLAAWLAGQGIGPGARVGIRIPRSAEALIAIHGVLRAGAAFVPLDPSYPDGRIGHMVDDAALAYVLDELPPLDPSGPVEGDPRAELPEIDLDAEAYVLYTSGSTGLAKGVPITHRGLSEYVEFARAAYLEPGERPVVALISSLSFDLTITSLFLPIVGRGTCVVYRGEGVTALRELADDRRVTWLKATPSHLELLVRLVADDHPLRTVVVGGEAFSRSLADRLRGTLGELAIYNEYGPTEAVVGCMVHRYDPALDTGSEVPIGRPAPGVELCVLDDAGQLVPAGIAGELHIARPGLTPGYLNRPDLDAERFVALDHLGGRRAYRSGDLVRFRDDATLDYLGRTDGQMKVQGIRLEPAEVEAALLEHPHVTGAAVRVWTPGAADAVELCIRCGLGSDVPGTTFDDDGLCSVCHEFDRVAQQAEHYFGIPADLVAARDRARARRTGRHDVLHLLSGGKDSTYALYQLCELGFEVFALTLDNGYISDEAKDNIGRVVADLGIEHEFATTDAMDEIFRDSLERFSNVCNGCYKTIYTLGVNRAHQLGIPTIVTGLSRGQFFETRLLPAQFEHDRFDPAAIDATVIESRKAYHRTADAVSRLLDVSLFDDDAIFDEIEFLDFYRYTDVELDEMLEFLDRRAPWIRPSDTGRSTNCLVNAAGIYTHRLERGFHNYALPYSWDVRVGHKTRDEAVDELDDEIDETEVREMLAKIGYQPRARQILTAWYTTDRPGGAEIDPDELRSFAAARLPAHAVPSALMRIDAMPLSANGKLDERSLPAPQRRHREAGGGYTAPDGPVEEMLCELWASVLGLDRVGAGDDFFDLGGTSLDAIEMIVAVGDTYLVRIPEDRAFRHRTVAELAVEVEQIVAEAIEEMDDASVAAELGDA